MNHSSPVTLRKVAPDANMHRQYTVTVTCDLFGTPLVICRWGRIGTAGQTREYVCATIEDAQEMAARLLRSKERRGYGQVGTQPQQIWRARAVGAPASCCCTPNAPTCSIVTSTASERDVAFLGSDIEALPNTARPLFLAAQSSHAVDRGRVVMVLAECAATALARPDYAGEACHAHAHRLRHTFETRYREVSGSDTEIATALGQAGLAYVRTSDAELLALLQQAF